MRKLIAIVAVTAAVLTMLVAGQTPASAHRTCVEHAENPKDDTPDYACVQGKHRFLTVCDREKGNYVEAWVWWPSGPLGFIDKDGYGGDCSEYKLPRGAHRLAICENREGCTEYVTV
jgi:hypothetical protein